jgi:hypothetical protein
MAEPTDREVRAADGWNAPTKNLPPIEPRDLLLRIGQEWGREASLAPTTSLKAANSTGVIPTPT